jgi:tyrosyl-tRNA synthetase
LAEEVTKLVHGEAGFAAAKRITQSLFSGSLTDLTADDFKQLAQDGMPAVVLPHDADLQQALVNAGLAPSRGQARTLIESNAIAINGTKITVADYKFTDNDKLFGQYSLLRRGKKHYSLLIWQ